jgi:hypothetical protein
MKKNTVSSIVICLFLIFCTHLQAQIRLNLFSYSDFFHAPNESFEKIRSFSTAVNKFNFSSQMGASIDFQFNDKLNIILGIQKARQYFDCDCVGSIHSKDFEYVILSSNCLYQSKTEYNMIQIPLSLSYSFLPNQKMIHSIAVGNTTTYNAYVKSTVFNSSAYIEYKSNLFLFSMFAPELYYKLDYNFHKKVSLNAIIGVRKESFNVPNYAIFGKVGLGYSLGSSNSSKRYKKR